MKKFLALTILSLICLFYLPKVYSHCQIPCGIYNDEMRFSMIEENILTIEKSIMEIKKLSGEPDKNYNQIIRWVLNKEKHADDIAHLVTFYFLSQRIKPVEEKDPESQKNYLARLSLLHEMLVYAMKAKQTADMSVVERLRSLLKSFRAAYFQKEADKHTH